MGDISLNMNDVDHFFISLLETFFFFLVMLCGVWDLRSPASE